MGLNTIGGGVLDLHTFHSQDYSVPSSELPCRNFDTFDRDAVLTRLQGDQRFPSSDRAEGNIGEGGIIHAARCNHVISINLHRLKNGRDVPYLVSQPFSKSAIRGDQESVVVLSLNPLEGIKVKNIKPGALKNRVSITLVGCSSLKADDPFDISFSRTREGVILFEISPSLDLEY